MSVQLAAQDFTTPNKGGDTFPLATMSASSTKPSFKSVTPTDNNSGVNTNSTSSNNTTTTTATTTTTTTNKTVTPHTSTAMNAAAGKHVHFGAEEESKDDSNTQSKRGLVSRRGGRYVSPGRPPMAPNTNTGAAATEYNKAFRGDDSVPSLCSAPSNVGIVSLPSESEKDKDEEETPKGQLKSDDSADPPEAEKKRPSSISCPTSLVEITSPLASKHSPRKDALSFDDADSKMLIRSPVPSTSSTLKKTPIKSPGNFQSLPSLDDPKFGSPMGFILSPGPATPSYKTMRDSFEKETKEDKDGEISLKVRDYTKEKFALTPTNFMVDYGKSYSSFDTSNVLNWLQSPTVNGLFSPGGLNSIMNTPKGPLVPRTPGTPTLSTSFFFSDVAGLKNGDTPKRGEETAKSPKKGLSSIICISPLASTRNRGHAHSINTPINYHDIFASPNPLLEDSPVRGLLKRPLSKVRSANDPSFDATQAERDLIEDEDLSVLLQLAGGNTPKPMAVKSAFRGGAKGDDSDRENLPSPLLPVIGDREGDSRAACLLRKSHTRDGDKDSFPKPTLGIRKSASSAADEAEHPGAALSKQNSDASKGHDSAQPYPVHSHYPPRPPSSEMYGAYGMHHHGVRPSGRMSVVVGGPPPSSRAPKPSPAPRSHMSSAQRRPSYSHQDPYAPPPMSYPPPPHGHYPPPGHMGMHPYHSHYGAPPRHHPPMPMYGSQPPHGAPKLTPKKAPKATKVATKQTLPMKRPSISSTGSGNEAGKPAKKPKKSPGGKKKNKSPQLTDKGERQKAAQTIAAVNAASGGKNDKAAALAAAILRGVTMRPSGKWQAQLYFAGKSRYIGVFDTREKAALAYEIAREKLKSEKSAVDGALSPKQTENAVNAARKAAFDGVNEKDPRLSGK